jgi:hypothetical protein
VLHVDGSTVLVARAFPTYPGMRVRVKGKGMPVVDRRRPVQGSPEAAEAEREHEAAKAKARAAREAAMEAAAAAAAAAAGAGGAMGVVALLSPDQFVRPPLPPQQFGDLVATAKVEFPADLPMRQRMFFSQLFKQMGSAGSTGGLEESEGGEAAGSEVGEGEGAADGGGGGADAADTE